MEKDLVGAVVGPGADKAGVFAVAEPVRDLFDGGLFQIVRQSGLAGGETGAGQNVTSRVGDSGLAEG